MIINNIDVPDLDFLDVDTMERFESLLDALQNISFPAEAKESEKIRIQCAAFCKYIDELFIEDIADRLFDGKYNIRDCLTALRDLNNEVRAQTKSVSDLMPQSSSQIDVSRKGIKLVTHTKTQAKFANLGH